ERTTSGPVTNTRPSGDMTTMSVSAGPYAAPPAAGPTTTEICGIRPDARIIAANTEPTASSDSTPSASRTPPQCQTPSTGQGTRNVVPTETERVVDGGGEIHLARLTGDDVQHHLGVEVFQVQRRRDHTVVNGQFGDDRLDRAGRAEQVPEGTLRGAQHRVDADGLADRHGLRDVADRSRRGVAVDVADIGRIDAADADRRGDRPGLADAFRVGRGDVVGVRAGADAGEPAVDLGPSGGGVLGPLQHH